MSCRRCHDEDGTGEFLEVFSYRSLATYADAEASKSAGLVCAERVSLCTDLALTKLTSRIYRGTCCAVCPNNLATVGSRIGLIGEPSNAELASRLLTRLFTSSSRPLRYPSSGVRRVSSLPQTRGWRPLLIEPYFYSAEAPFNFVR